MSSPFSWLVWPLISSVVALNAGGASESPSPAVIPSGPYSVKAVTFPSGGVTLVGNLYLPNGASRFPAVVILGPVGFVKEQSPLQYATRLAREGFVALAFDPRTHGGSAGEPRRWENAQAKTEDLQAALDFLSSRPEVDASRLFALGVCQGVNWTIEAGLRDRRIRALSLVAGHYLTRATAELYLGGPEKVEARLERARAAKARFEQSGEVEYIPIVSLTDADALLTAKPIYEWYIRWADRGPAWKFHGEWENRLARMSELDIWGHQVERVVGGLRLPTQVIHADHAASGPEIPKQIFAAIGTENKELVWLGAQGQLQFYEDPVTIDQASTAIARWFRAHLP